MFNRLITILTVSIVSVTAFSAEKDSCRQVFAQNIILKPKLQSQELTKIDKLLKKLNEQGVSVYFNPDRLKELGAQAFFQFKEKALFVDAQTFQNRELDIITPVMAHEARHALDLTSLSLDQKSPYRVFLKNNWGTTARYKNGFTIHEFLACAEELEVLFLRPDYSQLVMTNQSRPYFVGVRLLDFQKRLLEERLPPYEAAEASWSVNPAGTVRIVLSGLEILIGGEQVDMISGTQVISSWIDSNLAEQVKAAGGGGSSAGKKKALEKLIKIFNQRKSSVIHFRNENEAQLASLVESLEYIVTGHLSRANPIDLEILRQKALRAVQNYKGFLETFL